MVRMVLAMLAVGLLAPPLAIPSRAADFEIGIWRGTITAESPRAKDTRIETKAALHTSATGSQLYVEQLDKTLPVIEIGDNGNGTFDLVTAGPPTIKLRDVKPTHDGFNAAVLYETEIGAPLSGKASFDRMWPLAPPSNKPKCAGAPPTLASLCGAWSGISLRGQPKLLVIETITRNRQKIAWEIKARQSWGGESDLASAGMSFPYTEYVTDEALPLATLPLRTTGKLSYRFDVVDEDTLTGGHIGDPADRTVYTRVKR